MRLTSASFTEPRQLLHKVCLEKHHIIKKKKTPEIACPSFALS